jgi:hypothetical protein
MHRSSLILLAALVVGCSGASSGAGSDGGIPATDASAPGGDEEPVCDGSREGIPTDYPKLGPRCRSHFVHTAVNDAANSRLSSDNASVRGVRPMPAPIRPGFYDVGLAIQTPDSVIGSVWLFLPSLSPGFYRLRDGASGIVNSSSTVKGFTIEIVGSGGGAIWGRFLGIVCSGSCQRIEGGKFSAIIEQTPSDLELGPPIPPGTNTDPEYADKTVCDLKTDCPDQGICAIRNCDDHTCSYRLSSLACPAGQKCSSPDGPGPAICVPE